MRIDHLSNRLSVRSVFFHISSPQMVSKRSNYKDFVWAIELCRFGLKMIGLWPESHETNKNKFVSNIRAVIVFIMITFVCFIPIICSLVRIWGNMILMIDHLQITLTVAAIWAKFVIMRWKRSVLSLIVNMIAEDWMYLRIDTERNVMIRRAQIARFIVICGYFMTMFGFIVAIVLPSFGLHYRVITNLTAGIRVLPIQGYYFYDTDKSPQFEFTLVAQAITTFLACVIYTSVDALLAVIIFHICGQLENFRYRLLNLISSDNFANALHHNIETHLRLIRFADKIENVFTVLMLTLLFYFTSVFCLYSYPLVTVNRNREHIENVVTTGDEISNKSFSRIGFSLVGVIMLLAHTFFYCGGGQLMEKECEAVYRTLCDLEWYKWEPRDSKALILLMIRTSEPFRITAGKIFTLSMTTFCSVLKTSVGYISFLLAKRY